MNGKPHERYLRQAQRALNYQREGKIADALDALYSLVSDLGYGDPLVGFLVASKRLLDRGYPSALALVNYAKLSGYGTLDLPNVAGLAYVESSPYLRAIRLVNPAIAIAAIELIRSRAIHPYALMLGPAYSLVLTLARLIVFGSIDQELSHGGLPKELGLDEDSLVLLALLGENYPIARAVLGGKKLRIPELSGNLQTGVKSDLVAAAIARAVDRYLEEVHNPEGVSGELLDRLSLLLRLAVRRAKITSDIVRMGDEGIVEER